MKIVKTNVIIIPNHRGPTTGGGRNQEADKLANRAMGTLSSSEWSWPKSVLRPARLRCWFDAGRRNEHVASCGWVIKASYSSSLDSPWTTIAWASVLLPAGTTMVDAEVTGVELVSATLCKIAQDIHEDSVRPRLSKLQRIA